MKKHPYEIFSKEELILRDHLAIDRTALANERTFLSYARTALGVIIAGFTLVHFIDTTWIKLSGLIIVIFGISIFIFGIMRYRKVKNLINKIQRT